MIEKGKLIMEMYSMRLFNNKKGINRFVICNHDVELIIMELLVCGIVISNIRIVHASIEQTFA